MTYFKLSKAISILSMAISLLEGFLVEATTFSVKAFVKVQILATLPASSNMDMVMVVFWGVLFRLLLNLSNVFLSP